MLLPFSANRHQHASMRRPQFLPYFMCKLMHFHMICAQYACVSTKFIEGFHLGKYTVNCYTIHVILVVSLLSRIKPTRMKGTEVPNPRRSSACDCTCVLTRNRSLSCDSRVLATDVHSVLLLPMQSFLTSF